MDGSVWLLRLVIVGVAALEVEEVEEEVVLVAVVLVALGGWLVEAQIGVWYKG